MEVQGVFTGLVALPSVRSRRLGAEASPLPASLPFPQVEGEEDDESMQAMPQSDQQARSAMAARHLTLADLQAQFGIGLKEAAVNLGICITTLKRACRCAAVAGVLAGWLAGLLGRHSDSLRACPRASTGRPFILGPPFTCVCLGCRRYGIARWPRRSLAKLQRARKDVDSMTEAAKKQGTLRAGQSCQWRCCRC